MLVHNVYTPCTQTFSIKSGNYLEQVYNMSQCNVHSQVTTVAGKKVTNKSLMYYSIVVM